MTQAQIETFKAIKDEINLQSVISIVRRHPDGVTQRQVFETIHQGRQLMATEIGALYQLVSRNLSTAAKEGLLDDSESVRIGRGRRTVYRVPEQPLPPRKTKTQKLREENLQLRLTIQRMEEENERRLRAVKMTANQLESLCQSLSTINFNTAYDG